MKKRLFCAIGVLMTLLACGRVQSTELQVSDDADFTEEVRIGSFSLSNDLRGANSDSLRTLTFYSDSGSEGLSVNIYSFDDLFGYDADKDGVIDFYVKAIDRNFQQFAYLDADRRVVKSFSYVLLGEHEARVMPINEDAGCTDLRGLFGGKESLKDCFKRRMSSTHGIIMTCASSLIGPEGPLAVCASAALSCALWTPN